MSYSRKASSQVHQVSKRCVVVFGCAVVEPLSSFRVMGDVRHSFIVNSTPSELYDYLRNPDHFAEQLSGFIDVDLQASSELLEQGNECSLNMTRFGMSQPVKISIDESLRGERLSYRQTEGLFRQWRHVMELEAHGESSTRVTDHIHYTLPFGLFGHVFDDLYLNGDLKKILQSRAEVIQESFD